VDKQEATDFVIRELAKRRDRNEIVTELCQKTGGSRDQVQRFVQLVESQNRQTTAAPVSTPASTSVPAVPPARPAPPPIGAAVKQAAFGKREATDFVVGELAKRRDRNDITAELCRKTGGSWDQVQQFVQQIESQNRPITAVSPSTPAGTPTAAVPASRPAPSSTEAQTAKSNALGTQETTSFVISELAKHRNRNDLIMALCEKTGSSWDQAQRLVQQVESENRKAIKARQSPLLIIIGVGIVISGLLLATYTVVITLNGTIILFLDIPIPYLGNATYFCTGLAMMGGGVVGLLRTARSLVQ